MIAPISYIVVDDDYIDAAILNEYAKSISFFSSSGTYSTPTEAMVAIHAIKPQVAFLDIDMPEMNGISLLKKIKDIVPICVFVTSHDEYAIESFNLAAFDFILKPLEKERFEQTAARIFDYFQLKHKAAAYDFTIEQQSIIIKEGYDKIKLPQQDIIYLEAMQDYTKFVTEHKTYLSLISLSNVLQSLSDHDFIRVHRSYAVAKKKINKIQLNKLFCANIEIPIGKTYKTNVANLVL